MKKAYLLAGSISLLSLLAGVSPADASSESLSTSENAASLSQLQSAPVVTSSDSALTVATKPDQAVPQLAVPQLAAPAATAPTTGTLTPAPITIAEVPPASTSATQLAAADSMDQVTSVSQLSDVRPTDWAFQALQSLVEKYGCIAGYPDGTFRGNRAATRYELAAALNACLDVISDRFATKEDLAAVRKLQEEFAAELATLRGRVDGLEARTAKLEAQQFSTTTKLQGLAVMSFQAGAYSGGKDNFLGVFPKFKEQLINSQNGNLIDGDELNPTVIAATLLSLNTSFTGSDLLQTTLAAGNGGQDAIGTANLGTTPSLPGNTQYFNPSQYYWSGFGTNFFLYRLSYTFKPFKDVTITAGPQFYPSDIIDFNSFANAPASDFGSWFFINNPFIIPYALNFFGGAGAAVQWNPGQGPFTVKALYMAACAGIASRDACGNGIRGGFAGDPYQGSLELQYANTFNDGKNNFAARLQYTNSRTFGVGANAVGLNFELGFGRFGVFGRAGYAFLDPNSQGRNPIPYANPLLVNTGILQDNFEAITFMGGFAAKDIFIPGSLFAIAAGAPFITQDSMTQSIDDINDENQVNVEAFYRFPISDNISITPIFSAVFNPNNSSANPTIYQGVLRTTFTF
uniref:S-layer domain protein n=1 Tax=Cyanothece sp. (strain PCC 7425 / ATCC 29141) TaxID=395961 RepID=B8HXL5_CYAP4